MRRAVLGLIAASLLSTAPACVFYRGPQGVEDALEAQMGVELDREFGIRLGFVSTKIASGIARAVDDEDALGELHLSSVGVATFTMEGTPENPPVLDPKRLGLRGFETVLRAKDDGDDVLLAVRSRKGSVREAVLVVCDGEEVVITRFKGDLDALVRAAAAKQSRLSKVEVEVEPEAAGGNGAVD
ncbi:MAG TPA: DUF4252 domain-containing protein [Candidatus Polarisedimenticolaceae bacterium]